MGIRINPKYVIQSNNLRLTLTRKGVSLSKSVDGVRITKLSNGDIRITKKIPNSNLIFSKTLKEK